MIRPLLAAASLSTAGLAAVLATPAPAFDITAMTPAEDAAFGTAVRDWLMANPEVLVEMSQKLEAQQYADQAGADRRLLEENHAALFEDGASWVGGNPAGDITIVEFTDYRCGYCRKAFPEIEELVASDGNIRLVLKEFPILGEASLVSSRFAVAALQLGGPAAYKGAHDALIALRGEPSEPALARLAGDLGLDAAAVTARMAGPEVAAVIAANRALGQRLGLEGTPSFVVKGTMVRGYVPLEGMRQIVAGQRG